MSDTTIGLCPVCGGQGHRDGRVVVCEVCTFMLLPDIWQRIAHALAAEALLSRAIAHALYVLSFGDVVAAQKVLTEAIDG